jgi:hypothetical protein
LLRLYGNPPDWDNAGRGDELKADLLRESVNYKLLQEGHVYPMFYETLYKELRDEMVTATQEARAANIGIWSAERSTRVSKLMYLLISQIYHLSFLNFGGDLNRFINVGLIARKELRSLLKSYRGEKIGFLPFLINEQSSFPQH